MQLDTAHGRLTELCRRSLEAITLAVEAEPSPALEHAAALASAPLADARRSLEASGPVTRITRLRDARRALYTALMTARQALLAQQNQRIPLWRTLLPALSARRALASFRDAITNLLPLQRGDLAFSSFVAQSELRLLLAHPALGMLSPAARETLASAALHLSEPFTDESVPDHRFEGSTQALVQAFAELNGRDDLKQNDEQVLEQLLGLVLGDRSQGSVRDSVRSLLFALRGLDAELDAMADPVEGTLALPWSHLYARASELLAARFGATWHSGPPPRQ